MYNGLLNDKITLHTSVDFSIDGLEHDNMYDGGLNTFTLALKHNTILN